MSAQSEGEYAEASGSYYKAMRLEIDSYDRSYIPHNIGAIHTSNGNHAKALEYYFQAPERNSFLPQAFNNMAVSCHHVRLSTPRDSSVHDQSTDKKKASPKHLSRRELPRAAGFSPLPNNPSSEEEEITGKGIIHSCRGEQAIYQGDLEISEAWFDQAAEYWRRAIALSPDNYAKAQNWLKIMGRFSPSHRWESWNNSTRVA
ncbi:hypothetical protein GOP47_0023864 [Adiantum capillus-veneris]|uniref:Photosystem I assembly protein Ycf3 n=1 Tax=Adiantum capillus-veneris TaxID=13818 RepID=A0A9D4Z4V4_ADICA|nr:hypothetical protein GOP47_0023864 [Adiantum capillus-veneris]